MSHGPSRRTPYPRRGAVHRVRKEAKTPGLRLVFSKKHYPMRLARVRIQENCLVCFKTRSLFLALCLCLSKVDGSSYGAMNVQRRDKVGVCRCVRVRVFVCMPLVSVGSNGELIEGEVRDRTGGRTGQGRAAEVQEVKGEAATRKWISIPFPRSQFAQSVPGSGQGCLSLHVRP